MQIVRMKYRIYKELYKNNETVDGSYSSIDKTIEVMMEEIEAKEYHMHVEEIAVRVPYRTYKRELDGYYYKRDSYDPKTKTVEVYMTIAEALARRLA